MDLGATAALVARITLAAAFAWSAGAKLADFAAFARGLANFGVPADRVVARVLPVVEGAVAVTLVVIRDAAWPAFLAVAMLALFTAAVVANLLGEQPVPCPCFGAPKAGAPPVSTATVLRNGYLIALAVLGTGSTDGASTAAAVIAGALCVTATAIVLRRY